MSAAPVMIMAGGTGGHVFPGLAVAAALRKRGVDVVWLGTRRGLEAELVPPHGIEIEWITIEGLRGRGARAWVAAPVRLAGAVAQAQRALRRRRPAAVLGMGGFVSGPGGIAARLAGLPLLIHEQNTVPGTTNRWLARVARRVFEAFPGSFPENVGAECIGNPIRAEIAALPPPAERFAGREPLRTRLLVLGGSRGARALNRTVPAALALLAPEARPAVRHQAGAEHADARDAYRRAGIHADVQRFVADMAAAYAWADFVVARAGALTISELAAAGLGAVLVPYPYATDDHQSTNAAQLVDRGAAVAIAESALGPERLAAEIRALAGDRERLAAMAAAARSLAHADAAERLAAACIEAGRRAA